MVESLHWWEMRESHPLGLINFGFTDRCVYFSTLISHNWWTHGESNPDSLLARQKC